MSTADSVGVTEPTACKNNPILRPEHSSLIPPKGAMAMAKTQACKTLVSTNCVRLSSTISRPVWRCEAAVCAASSAYWALQGMILAQMVAVGASD